MSNTEDNEQDLMDRLKKAQDNANTEAAEQIYQQLDAASQENSRSMTPGMNAELERIKEQQRGVNPNGEANLNTNINANGSGISGNVDEYSPGQTRPQATATGPGSSDGVPDEEPDKPKSTAPTPTSTKPRP